jgi:hypothetical protein
VICPAESTVYKLETVVGSSSGWDAAANATVPLLLMSYCFASVGR